MIGSFTSKKPSAKIIKVEHLDENGQPLVPPTYEYWVVVMSSPPVVKYVALSFEDALFGLQNLNYKYTF